MTQAKLEALPAEELALRIAKVEAKIAEEERDYEEDKAELEAPHDCLMPPITASGCCCFCLTHGCIRRNMPRIWQS